MNEMSTVTNETGLVRKIWTALLQEYPDAWVFKVHGGPMQMAGVPDLLLCIDGVMIGVEVKFVRPGESHQHAVERATPGQRLQIGRIIAAGGMAGVVTSVEETLSLIERGLRRAPARPGELEKEN